MKFVVVVFVLIMINFALLYTDAIIDSIYSDPVLDGNMCYSPEGSFCSLNNTTYEMITGDIGVTSIPVVPINSTTRSFFSFELPEIPFGYEIDSVVVRLYQFGSIGGPPTQNFPIWNVAGGDTIKCILNHIDYGFELDPDDWEKGDIGNPYTYTNNVGTVTESGEDGYRYIDVTDCVLFDIQQERASSQYRISFPIDTDWDDRSDNVSFATAESAVESHWPNLFIYLSTEVNIEENEIEHIEISAHVAPNPFNPETTVNYQISNSLHVQLQVFNLKGQLLETLVDQIQAAGSHSVTWNAVNQSSGVYIYKLNTVAQTITGKCLLLK
jgi:Secretion system C-terminal sorting domain